MSINKIYIFKKISSFLAFSSIILTTISNCLVAMDTPQKGSQLINLNKRANQERPEEKEYLQRMSNPTLANQEWTNKWLEILVENCAFLGDKTKTQDILQLEFLLRLPQGNIRPDQKTVNSAFKWSVIRNNSVMIEYLLKLPKECIRPDQGGMNEVCSLVVDRYFKLNEGLPKDTREKYQSIIKTYQNSLKLSFFGAVNQDDLVKIEYILNLQCVGKFDFSKHKEAYNIVEKIKPNKNEIDDAFVTIAREKRNQNILKFFLNQLNINMKPSQIVIDRMYREAVAEQQVEIIGILMPHVSPEELNQHAGRAFEIHNYANAQVNTLRKSGNSPKPLIIAIFENMSSRVPSEFMLTFNFCSTIINNAINTHFPEEKRDIAKKGAFAKLKTDNDFEKQISLVVSFIVLNHYECMGTWIQGFVGESISAYKGSKDTVSCLKGIKERIATGLRTIDKELDLLFVQAEAPMLMKNYMSLWNPFANSPSKLAGMLMSGGLSSKHSFEDFSKIFNVVFDRKITEYGLSISAYNAEKIVIIEGLEEFYVAIQNAARDLEKVN